MAKAIKGKTYKHKKGNFYEVLNIGTHTETKEEMVVYREFAIAEGCPIYFGKLWVRPRTMFEDGRFELID